MKTKYFELFKSTFLISAFTFGGGYVIIPLMKEKFVDKLKWIEEDEMLNLIAIAQSSPGAVAVNTSILLGYKVGGILGAVLSILGTVLPPLMIISIISLFYEAFKTNMYVGFFLKSMQAAIVAIIFQVVFNLSNELFKKKDLYLIVVMFLAFTATAVFKINVAIIILACAVLGMIKTLLRGKTI